MFAVTGFRASIITLLAQVARESYVRIDDAVDPTLPLGCRRFVLAAGTIQHDSKPQHERSQAEMLESAWVNMVRPIRLCEQILAEVPDARICVVGSQSAYGPCFDRTYGAAKAGLQSYVHHRKVSPHQLLCAVSPGIIADSGMTMRRNDYPEVLARRATLPALDVARAIFEMLWSASANQDRLNSNRVVPVSAPRQNSNQEYQGQHP